jgi:membrane protease YdiL (CAAX protease family)
MSLNIKTRIKQYPLNAFFVITFAVSWTSWISIYRFPMPLFLRQVLNQVGIFGPFISSVIVTGILYGKSGVKKFIGRILQWQVGIHWYLFVLFGAAALCFAAIGLYTLLGGKTPAFVFILEPLVLISGLREEYGWRGFAFPLLQEKHSALKASVFIGMIWTLWHLPIIPIMSMGLPMTILFLSEVIAISILLTWVYNNTAGNILLPVLHHTAYNLTLFFLQIPTVFPLMLIYVVLNWILVIIIVSRYGTARLSRKPLPPMGTRAYSLLGFEVMSGKTEND